MENSTAGGKTGMSLERRQRIGKYEIMEELGIGAMATVYKAKNTDDGSPVAIKVPDRRLLTSVRALRQFMKEGQALIRLRHPNIVRVHSVGQQDELPYIVMDYVPGHTLSQEMHSRGKFNLEEVAEILLPLADALDYSHTEETFHCDVKPGNIRMYRGRIPLLVDFGIVQTASGTLWDEGKPVGSVWYMSPEQARGERASGQSDQYALAIVAYEMLTGHVPFDGDNPFAIVLQQRDREPPIPDEWSDVLKAVMRQALNKDPQKRFASCTEFVRSLKQAGRKVAPPPAKSEVQQSDATRWFDEHVVNGHVEDWTQEPAGVRSEPNPASTSSSTFDIAAAVAPARVPVQSGEAISAKAPNQKILLYAGLAVVGFFVLVVVVLALGRHHRPQAQTTLSSGSSSANTGVPGRPADQSIAASPSISGATGSLPSPSASSGSVPKKLQETENRGVQNAPVVSVDASKPSVLADSKVGAALRPNPAVPRDTEAKKNSEVPENDQPAPLQVASGTTGAASMNTLSAAPHTAPALAPVANDNKPNNASPSPGSSATTTNAVPAPVSTVRAAPAVANAPPATSRSSGFVPAKLLKRVDPVYPASGSSYAMGSGTVTVKFTVDETGSVQNPQAVSGLFIFREPAIKCVKQWRYQPATQDGRPVPQERSETIWFHL